MVPPNEPVTTTDAISRFLKTIRSSCILSERQFEKVEATMAQRENHPAPAELASRLVKDGILTEFQARQLLKGKSESLIFGSYVILDFLGKGTMGKVYKASHRMMGRVVALKILDPRYVSSSHTVARFQREMHLVGRLDHPNVVRAFDADRVADCHFIAMEYAAGVTLEDLFKARGTLAPADLIFYASQAAEGLGHAHARGVLHRDIKPSNLLVTEGRKLKILDFGLGTLLVKEELPAALTSAGYAVGTPDYISPEQARMVKLDGRSDLYSLGCTMYHLLSGQLPFKGESSMDCIVGRITGQAVPIREVRPGLPPRVYETIEKLMATNPDDRYQTADEAAVALRSLLRPKTVPASVSAPTAASSVSTTAAPTVATSEAPTAASAVARPAAAPAAVPQEASTPEAPSLPALAGSRSSKPKRESLRSRLTGRGKKATRILAAAAVAAVSLIVVMFALFRSSNDEAPASPGTLETSASNAPIVPAGGAGAGADQPSPAVENPQQVAEAAKKEDQTSPAVPAAKANVRPVSLVIEYPKQGATVGMREDLTGRIESEGWPVIFVQADIPGQPWWCQAHITKVDGGRFSTKVVFGDELTPPGTKFRVAGIVARTREDALKFDIGPRQGILPEGYPQSAVIEVTHQ
ncbi:MAG: serine/threonine protein kinase [Isosphaeraceae bacterium]